jgi:ABC-2 type transport system permease protein
MFDETVLWKERSGRTLKELSRYLRYIFNGHIVLVLVFLLGAAAYYYQEWLKSVSDQFPAAIIMALILGILLTYSPIYTFLTEADKIFLLPLETRLKGYFKRCAVISFAVNGYLLLFVLALLMPMYARVNEGDFKVFFPFLLVLFVIKAINLMIRWSIQYFAETKAHYIDSLIRYAVNAVFLYFLFSGADLVFLIPEAALLLILLFFYKKNSKEKGLKWEFLIEQEERRMASFYRLANMFTDVPKLKDKVKRRKWLDWLFKGLAFDHKETFNHLYIRTFLRAGDYFGLFVRLTLIGAGVIYFLSFGWGQLLICLLFLYLTGFQLLPLWRHHQNKLWVFLYPTAEGIKEKSFKRILSQILYIQALFFALAIMIKGEWVQGIICLAAGITFSYLFTNSYIQKRLQ